MKIWNKEDFVNNSYLEASRKAGDSGKGVVSDVEYVMSSWRDTYVLLASSLRPPYVLLTS